MNAPGLRPHRPGKPRAKRVDREGLEQAALMDGRLAASGEAPFAFGCLAMLAGPGPGGGRRSEDGFEIVEVPSSRRGPLDRVVDRLARRPVPGFVRRRGPKTPSILVIA